MLLNVLIMLFVVFGFLWLYSKMICVDVMFSVKCSKVVISSIVGNVVKFNGLWV